jgi:molybdate transport system substrate-binding protein
MNNARTASKDTKMNPVRIFAAGSLRGALTRMVETLFRRLETDIRLELGPSGVLRERMENGQHADLFISANLTHPKELLRLGLTEKIISLAQNEVCLFGTFTPVISFEDTINTLLDPHLRLGTSTPGDDPGGDYALEVFRLADAIRPGSYDILANKSLQLVGGRNSPPTPDKQHPVLALFTRQKIDAFLGYYTSALAIKAELPGIHVTRLPKELAQRTGYAMVKTNHAHPLTDQIIDLILGEEGRSILEEFGFQLPNNV